MDANWYLLASKQVYRLATLMDYEWLIDDNRVLISLIACSMNYETAVTFTYGYFRKVVYAVLLHIHKVATYITKEIA